LTPDQVRERLTKSLTADSFWDGFVGSASGFTGKIEGNSFSLRPCWRNHSAHPTLSGEVEKTETGSRIQFHVGPDPILIGMIISVCCAAVPGLLLIFASDIQFPLIFVPIALAFYLMYGLHSRNRAKSLLRFFFGLFEDSRPEKAVPPA
jgi:hypothetical protein